jgi:hypothetical protein
MLYMLTCTHTYIHIHTCTHTYMHTYIHTHIHTYIQEMMKRFGSDAIEARERESEIRVREGLEAVLTFEMIVRDVYAYMHACMYVCMCVCMCVYKQESETE